MLVIIGMSPSPTVLHGHLPGAARAARQLEGFEARRLSIRIRRLVQAVRSRQWPSRSSPPYRGGPGTKLLRIRPFAHGSPANAARSWVPHLHRRDQHPGNLKKKKRGRRCARRCFDRSAVLCVTDVIVGHRRGCTDARRDSLRRNVREGTMETDHRLDARSRSFFREANALLPQRPQSEPRLGMVDAEHVCRCARRPSFFPPDMYRWCACAERVTPPMERPSSHAIQKKRKVGEAIGPACRSRMRRTLSFPLTPSVRASPCRSASRAPGALVHRGIKPRENFCVGLRAGNRLLPLRGPPPRMRPPIAKQPLHEPAWRPPAVLVFFVAGSRNARVPRINREAIGGGWPKSAAHLVESHRQGWLALLPNRHLPELLRLEDRGRPRPTRGNRRAPTMLVTSTRRCGPVGGKVMRYVWAHALGGRLPVTIERGAVDRSDRIPHTSSAPMSFPPVERFFTFCVERLCFPPYSACPRR